MAAFIDLAIRAVALLSLAWIGAALLRRRSASVRASLWTAALAAVLLLPLVSVLGPAWRVPVLPTPPGESVTPVTGSAVSVAPAAAAASGNVASTATVEPPEFAVTIPPVTNSNVDLTVVALASLGLVTSILLVRTASAYRRMRRIANRAVEADAVWSALVDDARAELGIARAVAVRVTDTTNVPAVTGITKPVLLLPIDTDDWALDVRRAVVLHELAHVARRDAIGQLIGQVACALYWFVPLAWYGARRAAAFRERASDDVVIQAGIRPSRYAENLIALAWSSSHTFQSEATMAMAESRIHERVAAILTPGARRHRLTWRSAVAILALASSATVVVGAVEFTEQERTAATVESTAIQASTSVPEPSLGAALQPDPPAPPAVGIGTARRTPTTPDAPAMPQAASSTGRLCEGRGLDRSSSSIHENNNERRWTVELSGDGCSVDLRAEGKFEFNADFTDIARIDSNGFFRVDATDRGVRRQIEIESKGGTLTRTWRVDGRERPYDNEARAWFAAFLIELDRRTAIGVDVRLPILVRQGGVDAVLKETGLMSSDYARTQYYLKLPKATRVTPAETARVLKQAGSLSGSDHYLSELVRVYATNVQDATVRAALIDLLERMTSDHYQATSVETILGDRAPGPGEMDFLARIIPKMSSDHYKTQIMLKVLRSPSLTSSHRASIASASLAIDSDHYAAEVLQTLAKKGLGEDAVRRAFFEAAAKVSSDHYHGAVLNAVLGGTSVMERDLLDIIASAKGIGSDHYQAEVLERVARNQAATDRVRKAVLDAIAGMSSHYAEQVRRAAGK